MTTGRRLLLVEDDVEAAGELAELLEWEGFAVTCSANLGEAIAAWQEQGPEVALVDLELGPESGIDFVLACRERQGSDNAIAEPAIVILSGRPLYPDERMRLGDAVPPQLDKPLAIGALLALLATPGG